jgi:hypothetical protein
MVRLSARFRQELFVTVLDQLDKNRKERESSLSHGSISSIVQDTVYSVGDDDQMTSERK